MKNYIQTPNATQGNWDVIIRQKKDDKNPGQLLNDGSIVNEKGYCVAKAPVFKTTEDWKSDALLMASAPKLYKALAELVQALEAKGEENMDLPGIATLNYHRKALEEAREGAILEANVR